MKQYSKRLFNPWLGVVLLAFPGMLLPGMAAGEVNEYMLAKPASRGIVPKGPPPKPVGEQTSAWLNLQASGEAASYRGQYGTPTERELANQRLLDSYKHQIPEYFEQDAGGDIAK